MTMKETSTEYEQIKLVLRQIAQVPVPDDSTRRNLPKMLLSAARQVPFALPRADVPELRRLPRWHRLKQTGTYVTATFGPPTSDVFPVPCEPSQTRAAATSHWISCLLYLTPAEAGVSLPLIRQKITVLKQWKRHKMER